MPDAASRRFLSAAISARQTRARLSLDGASAAHIGAWPSAAARGGAGAPTGTGFFRSASGRRVQPDAPAQGRIRSGGNFQPRMFRRGNLMADARNTRSGRARAARAAARRGRIRPAVRLRALRALPGVVPNLPAYARRDGFAARAHLSDEVARRGADEARRRSGRAISTRAWDAADAKPPVPRAFITDGSWSGRAITSIATMGVA